MAASIDDLPLPDESFDVVRSEGAVYNIGFANGVSSWKRLLAPGGTLVVSELTWLTDERPAELDAHWNAEYPQVGTIDQKVEALRVAEAERFEAGLYRRFSNYMSYGVYIARRP